MSNNYPITHITIHCSSTKPSMDWHAKDIDRMHRLEKKFLKIGYHYVITRGGQVEKGRLDSEVGAHVQGHNTGNLGICLVGGLTEDGKRGENNFLPAQWVALEDLVATLTKQYPGVTILGHRDWPGVNKDCPCFDVKTWLNNTTKKS